MTVIFFAFNFFLTMLIGLYEFCFLRVAEEIAVKILGLVAVVSVVMSGSALATVPGAYTAQHSREVIIPPAVMLAAAHVKSPTASEWLIPPAVKKRTDGEWLIPPAVKKRTEGEWLIPPAIKNHTDGEWLIPPAVKKRTDGEWLIPPA